MAARVAAAIIERRMALPATLFLESVRPMNFLAGQAVHFFNPLLSVVLDFRQIEAFGLLLEKRGAVDLILGEIEGREARRKAERGAGKAT